MLSLVVCGSGGRSTTVTLAAVAVLFRVGRQHVDMKAICRGDDEYCGLPASPVPDSTAGLYAVVVYDLLWVQVHDLVDVRPESLNANRALTDEFRCYLWVCEKLYVFLLSRLASNLNYAHKKSE